MSKIALEPIDEAFIRFNCEAWLAQELSDHFTFMVPGAQFMPATDAVYKMSIKFTDFYKKDAGGFHYPFGKVFLDGNYRYLLSL